MLIRSKFHDTVEAQLIANGLANPSFKVWGIYDIEHWRRRQHGALYSWDMIHKESTHNVCTAEGLNAILDIMFHGTTQITTWYCLVFETDTTPSDATTYAVPVFTECQAYAEATRPEYVEAAASSKSITNSANKAVFTFNATKDIFGAALVGAELPPVQKRM